MSDEESPGDSKGLVGTSRDEIDRAQIYKLSKPQLIAIIQNQVSLSELLETLTVDTLRKRLVKLVEQRRVESVDEESKASIGEKKPQQTWGEQSPAGNNNTERVVEFNPLEPVTLSETTMAKASKLEFALGQDDWETYVERLELYFVANDVADNKKTAVLLTKISADTYTLVRDLCAPTKPKDKSFEQLVDIVSKHLCPKPSETMERCKFHLAKQSETETVADFGARLKKLALNCNFAELQVALRDQFVCGLKDQETKTELFRISQLSYDDAYKLAAAREEATKNATSTEKIISGISTTESMHAMFFSKKNQPGQQGQRKKSDFTKKRENPQNDGQKEKWQLLCYCCNLPNHLAKNCRLRFSTCNICQQKGHVEAACRKKTLDQRQVKHVYEEEEEASSGNQEDFLWIGTPANEKKNVFYVSSDTRLTDPQFFEFVINNKVKLSMEADSGSYTTVIHEEIKDKLFPKITLKPSSLNLRTVSEIKLPVMGRIDDLTVEFQGKTRRLGCHVVAGNGISVVGREWLTAFGLWPCETWKQIADESKRPVYKINADETVEQIEKKYPILFSSSAGLFNKGTLKLTLKENAKPVALKARHVAFALKDKVDAELTRLINLGHLEKVEVSEWATPIVPILKSDGSVRICGNFKLTVNPCLVVDRHPLPLIDEIFANLQGGQTFSQLDLAHAYMQVNVNENSRDCLTIITHKGLFRYTKLPEGVASGPADFQKKMEMCLAGIPNVSVYLDNIFCTGKTEKEHRETIDRVCQTLQDCGLRVNKQKCEFFKKSLEILGFIIDKDGLKKSPSKVAAMIEAPRPVDAKQLAAFLGLVTYYERFLPLRADKLKPLYECTREGKFEWTPECDRAFNWVKKELVSDRVLAHYDPKQKLVLACDASAYGLSAVISHEYPDGSERPIAFASKMIPEKELNRAILDKEAGAIVFGLRKFYNYLIGRKFTLKTDHKPLTFIFGPRAEIPATIASRLQRWSYFLSGFNFEIVYVKSEQNGNCDALSRLPVADSTPVFDQEFSSIKFIEVGLEMLDASQIAAETARDSVLKDVVRYVRNGWPSKETLPPEVKKFESKRNELSTEKKCLFWGDRIVIPSVLRAPILRELHASHMGIIKMKMTARAYVWWPGVDADIENVANACRICLEERKKPPKVPLTPWPWPDKPWTRIHSDFLGPIAGHMFMVVVDAHTKWPEVIDMGTNTQAVKVVSEFKKLFARFGLPRQVVTDNGRQYTSNEFSNFLARHGIKQTFTAPYHPATNGAAENFVGTFKNKIAKIMKEGKSLDYAVNLFLFDYRSTEHCTTKRSPAWLMFKRELRTRFDLLKPSVRDDVEKNVQAQIESSDGKRNVSIDVGDVVMVDDHRQGNTKRVEATIEKKLSPVSYEVTVDPTTKWKRHVDQIVPKKQGPRRSERLKAKACNTLFKGEENVIS